MRIEYAKPVWRYAVRTEGSMKLAVAAVLLCAPALWAVDDNTRRLEDAASVFADSRSPGLFAGVSVSCSTLRQDLDDNRKLYGKRVTNRDFINGAVSAPKVAGKLLAQFNKYTSAKR
jgi:lipid-binding SYLF domain-containing protein